MIHYDGKGMNKGYLSPQGGQQIDIKHISYWPVMPTPTEWQWKTWKSFVYRHWIKGDGTTSVFSPLERSFIKQTVDLKAQLEKFLSYQHSNISSAYSNLPPTLKNILGQELVIQYDMLYYIIQSPVPLMAPSTPPPIQGHIPS